MLVFLIYIYMYEPGWNNERKQTNKLIWRLGNTPGLHLLCIYISEHLKVWRCWYDGRHTYDQNFFFLHPLPNVEKEAGNAMQMQVETILWFLMTPGRLTWFLSNMGPFEFWLNLKTYWGTDFLFINAQTNSLLRVHTASMWSHTGAAGGGGGGQLWHHDNQGDQTLSIWPQLAMVQACSRKPRLPRGSQSGEIGQQRVSCIKPGNKSWVSKTVWNRTLQLYYCFNSMKGKKKNFNSI